MNERDSVIRALEETRALAGIRWAGRSALYTALDEYKPEAGHNRGSLGYQIHTYFRDRLDRVFACGRYALPEGTDVAEVDRALLIEQLSRNDAETMPKIATDLVVTDNLTNSPGWRLGSIQWLLSSAPDGIDHIRWPTKSHTKRRVAESSIGQIPLDSRVPTLLDSILSIESLTPEAPESSTSVTTFILAHLADPDTSAVELAFGRARMNKGGGSPWVWREDLMTTIIRDIEEKATKGLEPISHDDVQSADAPVRLRKNGEDQKAA